MEAESVAYVIGAAHGLDTSGYTIPYVTGWASADLDLLRGTAERVLTTARQVLAAAPPGPAFELNERPDGSRTLEPAARTPSVPPRPCASTSTPGSARSTSPRWAHARRRGCASSSTTSYRS